MGIPPIPPPPLVTIPPTSKAQTYRGTHSYAVIDAVSGTSDEYLYPTRIRPVEPNRLELRVRNLGTTAVQLAYNPTSTNENLNGPANGLYTITLQPGQEYLEPAGNTSMIFVRPNVSGQGFRVGVYCKTGAV